MKNLDEDIILKYCPILIAAVFCLIVFVIIKNNIQLNADEQYCASMGMKYEQQYRSSYCVDRNGRMFSLKGTNQ